MILLEFPLHLPYWSENLSENWWENICMLYIFWLWSRCHLMAGDSSG